MNAVTTVFYLWLSNDEFMYREIRYGAVESKEDLEDYVKDQFQLDNPTVLADGILSDLLATVDWGYLFDVLTEA